MACTFRRRNRASTFLPHLETLESRVTPVVGGFEPALATNDPLYNGVVRISQPNGTFNGSGVLLQGGNYILTAGHVVADQNSQPVAGKIEFCVNSSDQITHTYNFTPQDVILAPGFISESGLLSDNDVAVVKLNGSPPPGVNGFGLYKDFNEIGKTFTMVGFGLGGGPFAPVPTGLSNGVKRFGTNTFEAIASDFRGKGLFPGLAVNQGYFAKTLWGDFDNGTEQKNSLKIEFGIPSTTGERAGSILVETTILPGDSGGPAFVNAGGQSLIAGITSGGNSGDVPTFGRYFFYNRVSQFADFIEKITGTSTGTPANGPLFAINPLGTSQVEIHDASGVNPESIAETIQVFSQDFKGGIVTAMGDVNGDGFADLVAGAGRGGGPHVRIFSGVDFQTVLHEFFAFEPDFRGGVSLAVGDMDGDSIEDIVVGAGAGGGPRVRVFKGRDFHKPHRNADDSGMAVLFDSFVFEKEFHGGVTVATGMIDANSSMDLVVGAGAGGGPRVSVFDFASKARIQDYFAFAQDFQGGVSLAIGNTDGLGRDEIIVGAGAGGSPHVRVFGPIGNIKEEFFADDASINGGINVSTLALEADKDLILTTPGERTPEGGLPFNNIKNIQGFNGLQRAFAFPFPYLGSCHRFEVAIGCL